MAAVLSDFVWQPSLLAAGEPPDFDSGFEGAARRFLGSGAWVDLVRGWVTGADELFEEILAAAPWASHERPMYDRMVTEPRLTTRQWSAPPRVVLEMADALSEHYGLDLGVISANLYRNGRDSVAWHGDRVGRKRAETVVALVSLGASRRFLLRPKGGGPSVRCVPNASDLLVMGGTCQRTWEHCVPKCAFSAPRVSVMFREGY